LFRENSAGKLGCQRLDLSAQVRFEIGEERLLALMLRSQYTPLIDECQQRHHGQLAGGMNESVGLCSRVVPHGKWGREILDEKAHVQ
jgi:hypothetical protein